jgi:hypothetical protein
MILENGALAEDRHGDNNCSVGIPQRYVCQFGFPSATAFVKKYPEWKDWQFQVRWMADSVKAKYEKYHGDIFRTVVAHNSPVAAAANRDTKAGYWRQVRSREHLLRVE